MAKQSSGVGAKRYWREADARQALAALERSGLSLREYCERTGVSERKLRRWKRRLETATPYSTPGFREVRVVETPDQPGCHGRPGNSPAGLDLGGLGC